MDKWHKKKRSQVMSLIHSGNTKPELAIRSMLHRSGYRFRLHRKDLPGKPDIVLSSYKMAVFVNGCFWHQHDKCRDGKIPKSNKSYWHPKLKKNMERDKANRLALRKLGWRVYIVWECEIRNQMLMISRKLKRVLRKPSIDVY